MTHVRQIATWLMIALALVTILMLVGIVQVRAQPVPFDQREADLIQTLKEARISTYFCMADADMVMLRGGLRDRDQIVARSKAWCGMMMRSLLPAEHADRILEAMAQQSLEHVLQRGQQKFD